MGRRQRTVGNGTQRKHKAEKPPHKEGAPAIRIVLIADTHELHRQLDVPMGDILIHAGDFSNFAKRASQLQDFNEWVGELPHPFKVVVPGNHDYPLEDPKLRDVIYNATLLIDEGIEIGGLKIWGSPITPLYGGAFGMSKPEERKRHWAQVPDGIDILITHGPPLGILDAAPGTDGHQGDAELLEAVNRTKPRLHAFGHIHGAYGTLHTKGTTFVNASLYGEFGELEPPIVVELEPVRNRESRK